MKKKITLIEKIAMLWTFPIMLIIVLVILIITTIFYAITQLLYLSGTLGAAIYFFDLINFKLIDFKLKKLVNEDEKKYKFD